VSTAAKSRALNASSAFFMSASKCAVQVAWSVMVILLFHDMMLVVLADHISETDGRVVIALPTAAKRLPHNWSLSPG
jgi:hypothetical protein